MQREKNINMERNLDKYQENNLAELPGNHQIACNSICHAMLMKIDWYQFALILIMLGNFTTTLIPNLYTIILQESSYKHLIFISVAENSVDPGQLASQKPADQDIHCFRKEIYPVWHGMGYCMVFFFADSLFLINY